MAWRKLLVFAQPETKGKLQKITKQCWDYVIPKGGNPMEAVFRLLLRNRVLSI